MREAEPGQGILQMVVGEGEEGLAALRQAAGQALVVGIDEEGRDAAPGRWPAPMRLRVAGEPVALGGIVGGREQVAVLGGAAGR